MIWIDFELIEIRFEHCGELHICPGTFPRTRKSAVACISYSDFCYLIDYQIVCKIQNFLASNQVSLLMQIKVQLI